MSVLLGDVEIYNIVRIFRSSSDEAALMLVAVDAFMREVV